MESIDKFYEKATQAREEGRLGEALHFIKRALRLDTGNAYTWWKLAHLQLESGATEASIGSFATAIRLDPELADAYNGMGRAYYELKRYSQSEASFRKSVRLDPTVPEYHVQLGVALSSLHRNDEAIASYRRALRLSRTVPEYPYEEVFYNLGIEYKLKENLEHAARMFRETIKRDPRFAEAHRELGWIEFARKDTEQAREHLARALEIDEGDVWTHVYSAIVAWNSLREDEAERSYRRACELAPHDPMPFTCLGEFYMETDRAGEAEAAFREAISIDPQAADPAFHLGEFLVEAGRGEEARPWLEKALDLDDGYVEARELLERLDDRSR